MHVTGGDVDQRQPGRFGLVACEIAGALAMGQGTGTAWRQIVGEELNMSGSYLA